MIEVARLFMQDKMPIVATYTATDLDG